MKRSNGLFGLHKIEIRFCYYRTPQKEPASVIAPSGSLYLNGLYIPEIHVSVFTDSLNNRMKSLRGAFPASVL